jgi:hypothetical protein
MLASLLIVATPLPALAQFGFPGLPGGGLPGMRRGPLPLPLPVPGRGFGRGFFPGMPFGRMHRTFGILGAVVVGSIILGRLSRRDGVEVTRRTKVMLDRDRDREVVETYRTKDGGNQVTITAAPVQRVSDIKDDPVLKQTADTAKHATEEAQAEKQNARSKNTTKLEGEFLKVDTLPPETQCRKVTTEFELKTAAKRGGKKEERRANSQGPDARADSQGGSNKSQTSDNKSSNTSILCQTTGGEWKPASA